MDKGGVDGGDEVVAEAMLAVAREAVAEWTMARSAAGVWLRARLAASASAALFRENKKE